MSKDIASKIAAALTPEELEQLRGAILGSGPYVLHTAMARAILDARKRYGWCSHCGVAGDLHQQADASGKQWWMCVGCASDAERGL